MRRSYWFGATLLVASCSSERPSDAPSRGGADAGRAGGGAIAGRAGGVSVADAGRSGANGGFSGGGAGAGGTGASSGSSGRGGGVAGMGTGGKSLPGGQAGMGNGASDAGTDGAAGDAAAGAAGSGHWQPGAGLSWQWQLSESVGSVLDVKVYDIDWESDASVVETLHAQGIRVICYVSVGSWEDFRPDAGDFPDAVIGNDYDGWPGEKYLDIRSDATRALMLARFDVCRDKGFDAIEPDNMDVFELGSASGFPLTRADGVGYALWLAAAAHERGLGIGQKNASELTDELESTYDWALTESCFSDDWCGDVAAYARANKPVFQCEYEEGSFTDACSTWLAEGFSPILKNLDLDAEVTFCP